MQRQNGMKRMSSFSGSFFRSWLVIDCEFIIPLIIIQHSLVQYIEDCQLKIFRLGQWKTACLSCCLSCLRTEGY